MSSLIHEVLASPFRLANFIVYKTRAFILLTLVLIYLFMQLRVYHKAFKVFVTRFCLELLSVYHYHLDYVVLGFILTFLFWQACDFCKTYETLNRDYTPEKVRSESKFEPSTTLPGFQAPVWASLDGENFYPKGQGFRHHDIFITARHVIEDTKFIRIVGFDNNYVDVSTDLFEDMDLDITYVVLTQVQLSKLRLCSAKFANVVPATGIFCSVSAFGQRSYGMVKPHTAFGYVEYTGSTIGGFSGAPYYSGRTVFGMHVGGDSKNIGFDITYINSMFGDEDSAEWLIGQIDRYKEFEGEQSPFNSDDYFIRVGGIYHMVDYETYDKILSKRPSIRKASKKNVFSYDPESFEKELSFLAKGHPQEAAEVPHPKVSQLKPVPQSQATFQGETIADASLKERKSMDRQAAPSPSNTPNPTQESKSSRRKKNWGMSGRKSMPARRKYRSTYTTESIGNLKKELNIPELEKTLTDVQALLQSVSASLMRGEQTSQQQQTPMSGSKSNSI